MHHDKFLTGKIAIVTGGGRGIGKAVAIRLSGLGAETILAGTTAVNLEKAVAEIHAKGGKAHAIRCDVSKEEDVLHFFAETAKIGPIDILINNAGIGRFAPLVDTSVQDWDLVQAINLRGAFLCSREAMKAMAGRGGRIINISSVVGIKGYKDQAAYTASKHGLMGLSKVMSVEGQKDDIITQVIAPGGVDTDMAGVARPDLDRSKMITPDDIADAAEYLLGQTGNSIVDLIQVRRRGNQPW